MSVDTATMPVRADEIVSRVVELSKDFRSRVPVTEAQRSVPRDSIDDMVNAGLARMMVPTEYGGLDLGVRPAIEAVLAAARGCASTGWLSWLMIHVPNVVAMFPAEAQDAVWRSGPDVITCGSHVGMTVTPVADGYRISGRGAFTSGVNNAEWVYVGGFEPGQGGPPKLRYFLLHKDQYVIEDVWDTVGMRGTGSNTVLVDNLFVPEAFTLLHDDAREGTGPGTAHNSSRTPRLPWAAKGSLGFIATILGATQGAYDEVVTALATKRGPGGVLVADNDVVQVEVGIVTSQLESAYLLVRGMADRSDQGGEFTVAERASIIGRGTFLVTTILSAIDKLMELAGTSGFASTADVQQAWRDVHFATAHIGLSRREPNARRGRLAMGLPDPNPGMFF